jgi:hypothetical protein
MRARTGTRCVVGLAALACTLALSAAAGAVTIGQLAPNSGASCTSGYVQAESTSASPSYAIPAGGGVINHWSTATFGASAGASVSLLVLTQLGTTSYQIDSFNTQVLPTPLPSPPGSTVTFTPSTPLYAPAGAVLGLYGGTPSGAECLFSGLMGDAYSAGGPFSAPATGGSYTFMNSPNPGARLNVAANLVQTVDVGLTIATHPTVAIAGGVAAFTFTLTNTGVSTGTANFSDSVPNGLAIVSAVAGSGTCSTISQLVSCSIAIGPGASAPISIVVSTSRAGAFTNTGTATTSIADPNLANNAATATLTVKPSASAASCHVLALKGVALVTAKGILRALGCRVGKLSTKSSKRIANGDVISTSPAPGSKPAGTRVKITVSSGKPRKHK